MKTAFKFIILFIFISFSVQCFSQGKIDKSKSEIKNGNNSSSNKPSASSSSSSGNSSRYNDCDTTPTLGEIIGGAIIKVFLYATYYSTIGDYNSERHLKNKLTKYPYYNHFSGNYKTVDTTIAKKNRARADIDYQFLYSDKNLTGHYVNIDLRPFQYFYLQAQYRELTEITSGSRKANLSLFHFNFCYDRLRFEKFNMGWKLGASYIANNINKAGFSGGLDGEAFICKPISLYVAKQWSKINGIATNTFDAVGKFHINRYNFQLGYEHLKIGTPLYDYISLGVGVKL